MSALPIFLAGALGFPRRLFTGGTQGAIYDISDINTLYQDTSGATPVTAAGQSVARVNDKSGNNHHLTQSIFSAQPIYRIDGNGRPYLEFDGTDDHLRVVNFDLSASDAMLVCAGARKLSDAAAGVVTELSANSGSNNGTFALFAPGAPLNNFTFVSRGTAGATAHGSATLAPVTAVLTGQGRISTDQSIIRVNTTQVGTSPTDQGTGNYGAAYTLFVGMRNGTGLPFNGWLYGMVIRGGVTSDDDRASLEAWMNTKTGAY